jgi:predicted TIM-barrel fold metal-dependent hydrolase
MKQFKVFDSHFHIIDKRFPLVVNQGFLPDEFTCREYLEKTRHFDLAGGVIVSGSFQAFDQDYLVAALEELGPRFVGVTQLPETTGDEEILRLNNLGIRGVRFNLKRGGSAGLDNLERFAARIHDLAGWHVELYIDALELEALYEVLISLPKVSIAHLGLSAAGFPTLLKLAEKGVFVKATGFSRVDFDVPQALRDLYAANPNVLIFGTDLPSTRAPIPYSKNDLMLVVETLGDDDASKVFYDNAMPLYQPPVHGVHATSRSISKT